MNKHLYYEYICGHKSDFPLEEEELLHLCPKCDIQQYQQWVEEIEEDYFRDNEE